MATKKQIRANRRNAERSTGPRTEEGKAQSRMNAMVHGLCADRLLTADESAEEFGRFATAMREDLAPVGEFEDVLVQRLIMMQWRARRGWRIEAAWLDQERPLAPIDPGGEMTPPGPEPRDNSADGLATAWMIATAGRDGRTTQLLMRYQVETDKGFYRALRELDGRQKRRWKREEAEAEAEAAAAAARDTADPSGESASGSQPGGGRRQPVESVQPSPSSPSPSPSPARPVTNGSSGESGSFGDPGDTG